MESVPQLCQALLSVRGSYLRFCALSLSLSLLLLPRVLKIHLPLLTDSKTEDALTDLMEAIKLAPQNREIRRSLVHLREEMKSNGPIPETGGFGVSASSSSTSVAHTPSTNPTSPQPSHRQPQLQQQQQQEPQQQQPQSSRSPPPPPSASASPPSSLDGSSSPTRSASNTPCELSASPHDINEGTSRWEGWIWMGTARLSTGWGDYCHRHSTSWFNHS